MSNYTFDLRALDRTMVDLVGGKGANLGELTALNGINVPDGFCLSTEAFLKRLSEIEDLVVRLDASDEETGLRIAGRIRELIRARSLAEQIEREISELIGGRAYAVRSSATTEDLPEASFAGQQDSFLNLVGTHAVFEAVRECWASLFSDRAVIYRRRNGFGHAQARMGVVVQEMVAAQAAGTLFTADPLTSNRKTLHVEAVSGLADAMVSGLEKSESYTLREGEIMERKGQLLSDEQLLELERLGRKVERHFGCPQDIEWCWDGNRFWLVQARPITTLFPIPEREDDEYHVYLSVGHQQMMTAPLRPLGISMWQMLAARPMYSAAGRLFVDVTQALSSEGRAALLDAMGQHDPLIRSALELLIDRDFEPVETSPKEVLQAQPAPEPAQAKEMVEKSEAALSELAASIRKHSGVELFDFIREDISRLFERRMASRGMGLIMAAINASRWLNEKMEEWLGEKNVADVLSQSVSNNVTSEMGLALLDVADTARQHPELLAFLARADDDFLNQLAESEFKNAFRSFLGLYGMRCVGEIDITNPRWAEQPSKLLPLVLSHVGNLSSGESERRFEHGRKQAKKMEREIVERLRLLPDGEVKVQETRRNIRLLRSFIGYREYPKYIIVRCLFHYKLALMREVDKLVQSGKLAQSEDAFFLTFDELRELVDGGRLKADLRSRREEFRAFEKLNPPRVLTSDGEIVTGSYKHKNLPPGALGGLGVSAGVVEGRARVLQSLDEVVIGEEDILVATFTDPSWTPLFLSVKGLVTEIGGLMTHGSVIAREYGLPAVVGVLEATRRIQDGQRIRVHGTDGYVELLSGEFV